MYNSKIKLLTLISRIKI